MNASMVVPAGAPVPLSITSPENLFGSESIDVSAADACNTAPDNTITKERISIPLDVVLLILIYLPPIYTISVIDEFEIKE